MTYVVEVWRNSSGKVALVHENASVTYRDLTDDHTVHYGWEDSTPYRATVDRLIEQGYSWICNQYEQTIPDLGHKTHTGPDGTDR